MCGTALFTWTSASRIRASVSLCVNKSRDKVPKVQIHGPRLCRNRRICSISGPGLTVRSKSYPRFTDSEHLPLRQYGIMSTFFGARVLELSPPPSAVSRQTHACQTLCVPGCRGRQRETGTPSPKETRGTDMSLDPSAGGGGGLGLDPGTHEKHGGVGGVRNPIKCGDPLGALHNVDCLVLIMALSHGRHSHGCDWAKGTG